MFPGLLISLHFDVSLSLLNFSLFIHVEENKMDVSEGAVDKDAEAGKEGSKRRFKKIDLVVVTEAFGMNKEMLKAGMYVYLIGFFVLDLIEFNFSSSFLISYSFHSFFSPFLFYSSFFSPSSSPSSSARH